MLELFIKCEQSMIIMVHQANTADTNVFTNHFLSTEDYPSNKYVDTINNGRCYLQIPYLQIKSHLQIFYLQIKS